MTRRFNPPPNWPAPPPGFNPQPGWEPDPSFPPPPPGWQLWIDQPCGPERTLAVLRRIYLGPTHTPVTRKAIRAGLLGLLTVGLAVAPFGQETPTVPADSPPAEPSVTSVPPTATPPTSATATPSTTPPPSPRTTRPSTTVARPAPPPKPRPRPTARAPRPTRPPPISTRPARCDPSYPDVCIPPAPPDLDCKDIPHTDIKVLPPDPHRLDGGGEPGIGCES